MEERAKHSSGEALPPQLLNPPGEASGEALQPQRPNPPGEVRRGGSVTSESTLHPNTTDPEGGNDADTGSGRCVFDSGGGGEGAQPVGSSGNGFNDLSVDAKGRKYFIHSDRCHIDRLQRTHQGLSTIFALG